MYSSVSNHRSITRLPLYNLSSFPGSSSFVRIIYQHVKVFTLQEKKKSIFRPLSGKKNNTSEKAIIQVTGSK